MPFCPWRRLRSLPYGGCLETTGSDALTASSPQRPLGALGARALGRGRGVPRRGRLLRFAGVRRPLFEARLGRPGGIDRVEHVPIHEEIVQQL